MEFHYGVLHQRYIDTVNELLTVPTDDLLDVAAGSEGKLHDAALQAWNHAYFWQSMRPVDSVVGTVSGPLAAMVKRDFGGMGMLREKFVEAGMSQFGSGWVWLCICSEHHLVIKTTPNADNPILWADAKIPVLVCDLWEHSYYLDFGPDREHYLATWFDLVADFDFAGRMARRVLHSMAQRQ